MPDAPGPLVAIHQPNFFPWLGYFDKIRRADVFVLLDDVQYPKKGGNWSNHVRVLVQGRPAWISAPVVRSFHGVRGIREMEIDGRAPWRSKLLRTLEVNYRKAAAFEEAFSLVAELIGFDTGSLSDFNTHAIRRLVEVLGLGGRSLVCQSTLGVEGKATDLLVGLVRAVDGAAYLCGGGAEGYQEDDKFAEAGLKLVRQAFVHPIYGQRNAPEFVPGLSVIDVLMQCGVQRTKELLAGSGTFQAL